MKTPSKMVLSKPSSKINYRKHSVGGFIVARSKSVIYKITISNFFERRPGHKKSFKKMMLTHDFCDDGKLNSLPVTYRWLYLKCLLTCANSASEVIKMTEKQVRTYLESSASSTRALNALQSLQLLTWEFVSPLINELNELNELNESISTVVEKTPPRVPPKVPKKSGPVEFKSPEILYDQISEITKNTWLKLYNEDHKYITREVHKAFAYYHNNPRKAPKTLRGWTQSLSSWLERGWKSHVKSIQGNFQDRSNDPRSGEVPF